MLVRANFQRVICKRFGQFSGSKQFSSEKRRMQIVIFLLLFQLALPLQGSDKEQPREKITGQQVSFLFQELVLYKMMLEYSTLCLLSTEDKGSIALLKFSVITRVIKVSRFTRMIRKYKPNPPRASF